MSPRYLVDTDWAIHYMNRQPEIVHRLAPIDEEVCSLFGRERGRLRAAHTLVGDFDLLIGATALRHNLVLLTNNRRHFERIEGLRLENLAG